MKTVAMPAVAFLLVSASQLSAQTKPTAGSASNRSVPPPKTMRLCISPTACANLTWTGDHYDASGDNETAVSSRYTVTLWSADKVVLKGTTVKPVDGVNPAVGVFHGKISAAGGSLDDAMYDWHVGTSKSGTSPFTLVWGKNQMASAKPDTPARSASNKSDGFQQVQNRPVNDPFRDLPPDNKSYPAPPTPPNWKPDPNPSPGPDLNGVWEWDPQGKSIKLLIVQVRNHLWAANLQQMPDLATDEVVMTGEYTSGQSNQVMIRLFSKNSMAWLNTALKIGDANNIVLSGEPFHRVSTNVVKDMPCSAAAANRVPAQEAYARGQIYYTLDDIPAAACWYHVSATGGYAEGQASYGLALRLGRGIAQDKDQAFHWFQLSAMQNNYYGIYNLLSMMMDGYGPRSLERLTYWEKRARVDDLNRPGHNSAPPNMPWAQDVSPVCKSGNAGANGDQALAYGIVAFQAMVFSRAACWFTASERQGNVHAAVYLGILNVYGFGVPLNQKAGFDYMKKAADGGDWFGVSYLAEFYRRGIGTPADFGRGRELWDKATSNNPAGYRGGNTAYSIVAGTLLNDTQAREMRNDLLSGAFSTACTSNQLASAKAQYGLKYESHLGCDNTPETRAREKATSDALTQDLFIKNTVEYPEEISPEYVPPGNPFAF